MGPSPSPLGICGLPPERSFGEPDLKARSGIRRPYTPRPGGAMLAQGLERLPHRGVAAAPREELLVAADLGDAAGVEEDDAVGGAGGLQAVGDDDRRALAREALHRGRDAGLVGQV